ncbi:tetratricopeptide repeat protein [Alcanivorax sp.]|uniref:tetratricopeptide repeat protein n=1 Tax=Alcanivorax sp. TaxID=1872427 RepID=UPI0039E54B32
MPLLSQQCGITNLAEDYYRQSIAVSPDYTAAYINLADLYRERGDELACQALLQDALPKVQEQSLVYHSLGLSLLRQ